MAENGKPHSGGHQGIPCLVCKGPVEILDHTPPTWKEGSGWSMQERSVLVACEACGTVRLYLEHKERFDQGNYVKRSLR